MDVLMIEEILTNIDFLVSEDLVLIPICFEEKSPKSLKIILFFFQVLAHTLGHSVPGTLLNRNVEATAD